MPIKKQLNRSHSGKYWSLLATSLMLTVLSCAPTQPTPITSSGATPAETSASSSLETSPENTETELKANSIAIKASAQAGESGYTDLSQFQLPDEIDISQVSVVQASLDGRELSPEYISLGTDEDGSIVFFLSKEVLEEQLFNLSENVSVSMHSAEVFTEKTDSLRAEILENYKGQITEEVEEQIPTPSFLAAEVRGESLSRQEVASLKKDAAKLSKEGIFIDRNFYCVLSVSGQAFSVQQTQSETQYFINKFTLPGDQIEKLAAALKERDENNENILQLPGVAEYIRKGDPHFFHVLDHLEDADKVVEIEEIEEILELEFGAELAPKGVQFDEFELPLDLRDLERIEKAHPNLARRPLAEASKDQNEDLGIALARAEERVQKIDTEFLRFGLHPIPDAKLFVRGQQRPPRFGDVPLRRPASAFQIPPHLLPPGPGSEQENPALPDGTCPPPPPKPDGTPVPAPTPLENGSCPVSPESTSTNTPPLPGTSPSPEEGILPPPPPPGSSPPPKRII